MIQPIITLLELKNIQKKIQQEIQYRTKNTTKTQSIYATQKTIQKTQRPIAHALR